MRPAAIITGASKGIGRDVSIHFAKLGYNLLLVARSRDLLEDLKNEIEKANDDVSIELMTVDVTDRDAINEGIEKFNKKYSPVTFLFNNAGYVKRGTSLLEHNELRTMIDVNIVGAINVVQAVIPFMKAEGNGCIINMCSRNAKIPRSFLGGYAATKSALLAFNESLYKELKQTGLRVTAMCPGFVDTEMTSELNENRDDLIKTSDICRAIDFIMSLSPSVAIKELSFESIVQVNGYC